MNYLKLTLAAILTIFFVSTLLWSLVNPVMLLPTIVFGYAAHKIVMSTDRNTSNRKTQKVTSWK